MNTDTGTYNTASFKDTGIRLSPKQIRNIRKQLKESNTNFALITNPADDKPIAIVTLETIIYPPYLFVTVNQYAAAIATQSGTFSLIKDNDNNIIDMEYDKDAILPSADATLANDKSTAIH